MTPRQQFSTGLQSELVEALEAFASSGGAPHEREGLEIAVRRVCEEAHELGMSAESMVIATRAAYDSVPAAESVHTDVMLRVAYDDLLSKSLRAYFEHQERSESLGA